MWANRANVTVGQGAAAVEVPMAARNIAELNRWTGRL
jgi:hypothetical protein